MTIPNAPALNDAIRTFLAGGSPVNRLYNETPNVRYPVAAGDWIQYATQLLQLVVAEPTHQGAASLSGAQQGEVWTADMLAAVDAEAARLQSRFKAPVMAEEPAPAQPAPGGEDRRDAAGQIEHLDAENHALREQVKALQREASTWNAALTSLAARMEILRQGHPRLEVRYWTGRWWEPLHGVRLDECLNAIAAMSPPPTSGTSRPFTEAEHAAWERENGVGEAKGEGGRG